MSLFLELFRESLETASVWGRSANTSAYDYEGTTRCQAMDHGDDQKVRGEWEESAMRVLHLEGAKERSPLCNLVCYEGSQVLDILEVETPSYWLTKRECKQMQLCLRQRVPPLHMVVFCHGCNNPGFPRLPCHVLLLFHLLED